MNLQLFQGKKRTISVSVLSGCMITLVEVDVLVEYMVSVVGETSNEIKVEVALL